MRALSLLVFVAAMLFTADAFAADFNVTVGTTGGFTWTVNGQSNPTLALVRGNTYTFAVNSPGHPFDIKTSPVTGTASQFTEGVTGEQVTSGTLTFVVPADAPSTLFYQCEVHGSMSGTLQITSSPAAPALRWPAVLLLATAIGAAGLGLRRVRMRASPA